jgi:BirA family transcriptional regulator, biotin operon repressor / biotin---[acetyl-CoA-carboxylase] ligase
MTAFPPAAQPLPDDVAAALARYSGRLGGFASRVTWYDTVASTNDVADRAAAAGAPHGTVVVAEAQDGGRGRLGRAWFSPPGAGLYVSVVIQPEELVAPEGRRAGVEHPGGAFNPSWITLTAAVAIHDAIRAATGVQAHIKWPNDLVVGGRKVCGILAETASSGGTLQHVTLGFGINVHAAPFPTDIADRATSIEGETGRPADRALLLAEALACLAERLRALATDGFEDVLARWRDASPSVVGARVEVTAPAGWIPATTAGVDESGALLVDIGGTVRRVIAGEVRWLHAPGA